MVDAAAALLYHEILRPRGWPAFTAPEPPHLVGPEAQHRGVYLFLARGVLPYEHQAPPTAVYYIGRACGARGIRGRMETHPYDHFSLANVAGDRLGRHVSYSLDPTNSTRNTADMEVLLLHTFRIRLGAAPLANTALPTASQVVWATRTTGWHVACDIAPPALDDPFDEE